MVSFLGDYATHHRLEPRFGVEVRALERDGEVWTADTGGAPIRARQVVLASGFNSRPELPEWPGAAR